MAPSLTDYESYLNICLFPCELMRESKLIVFTFVPHKVVALNLVTLNPMNSTGKLLKILMLRPHAVPIK